MATLKDNPDLLELDPIPHGITYPGAQHVVPGMGRGSAGARARAVEVVIIPDRDNTQYERKFRSAWRRRGCSVRRYRSQVKCGGLGINVRVLVASLKPEGDARDEDQRLERCVVTVSADGQATAVYRWSGLDVDGRDTLDEDVSDWKNKEIQTVVAAQIGCPFEQAHVIRVEWE